jgi:acyl-CoA thioester hydrolase
MGFDFMTAREYVIRFRVRYSETDQMGTFYNSRALEWFECGRTELLRALGLSYAAMEAQGIFLPLTESHVEYQGRARYDDLLEMTTRVEVSGRARLRFDVAIVHCDGGPRVACGYTIHAITDTVGKPVRPPTWLVEAITPSRSKQ